MIKIIMKNNKWRLIIGDDKGREEWKFEDRDELLGTLITILKYKDKYGRIRKCS